MSTEYLIEGMAIIPVNTQLVLSLPFLIILVWYIWAGIHTQKRWPLRRSVYWVSGVLLAISAVAGPLATRAHMDLTFHMIGHLFLGMAAPLLMALGAPMTLLMRTMKVRSARGLSQLLRSRLSYIFTHPVITSVLNIGGLWLLYTTELYTLMHEYTFVYIFVHVHVFIAGYLFTISMIYVDPVPHRKPFLYRSIVLVIALAGHSILSKFIYANPPEGIPVSEAENAGMLMYYGGDAIDFFLIFILCLHWYRSTRLKPSLAV